METLALDEARRIALAAQGFSRPRPAAPGLAEVEAVIGRLGVLQIDSVNVLARAHYLPLFARLGPYDATLLDALAYGHRRVFEYWGHVASYLPVDMHPLFRHRMAGMAGRARFAAWAEENAAYLDSVRAQVRERGPLAVAGLEEPGQRSGPWWGHARGRTAFDVLFLAGEVAVAHRRNFTRYYDIPERVLPDEVLAAPEPPRADAVRELVRRASVALGVATVRDLADYFRLAVAETRRAVTELVDGGALEPVAVAGWRDRAFLARGAEHPGTIEARALVSPFDSLVWERSRTERLFGMNYRIEIYVPEAQRRYGYYVLPFLLGETLVARVDLKADRAASVLRVQAAHAEPGHDAGHVATALAAELRCMAGWLGLERVVAGPRGGLARPLRAALRAGG